MFRPLSAALAAVVLLHAGPALAGPLAVSVTNANYDANGFVRISGEIRNNTGNWVCAPGIAVELLDASGKPLVIKSIVTALRGDRGDATSARRHWLPREEVTPFTYLRDLKKIEGTVHSHRITAHAHSCATPPPDLKLTAVKSEPQPHGLYAVSGQFQYLGGGTCRSPRAVLGYYGADGRLIDSWTKIIDAKFQQTMNAGESVDFTLKAMPKPSGTAIAEVKAWADCDSAGRAARANRS